MKKQNWFESCSTDIMHMTNHSVKGLYNGRMWLGNQIKYYNLAQVRSDMIWIGLYFGITCHLMCQAVMSCDKCCQGQRVAVTNCDKNLDTMWILVTVRAASFSYVASIYIVLVWLLTATTAASSFILDHWLWVNNLVNCLIGNCVLIVATFQFACLYFSSIQYHLAILSAASLCIVVIASSSVLSLQSKRSEELEGEKHNR